VEIILHIDHQQRHEQKHIQLKIQAFQGPILKTGISGMIDLIYDLVNLQIRRYIYLQPYLELELEMQLEPSGAMPPKCVRMVFRE
jgi:hypothetical protein